MFGGGIDEIIQQLRLDFKQKTQRRVIHSVIDLYVRTAFRIVNVNPQTVVYGAKLKGVSRQRFDLKFDKHYVLRSIGVRS
ncbi:hypothetical protein [Achromobacter phage nyashin_LB6]|nr:hypothetical protein [Achromobacter phage nyashin_LB6]